MKKAYLGALLLLGTFSYAQVGIKTSDPQSTLDVSAENSTGTSKKVDGLLVPRVDRQRAQSMTGIPTSTMVFVNNVGTGTQTGTTVNVDTVGYYFFNGSVWVKLDNPNNSSSSSVNIYNSDGSLTGNRTVNQAANTLTFNGTSQNAFSVDGNTLSVDAANDRLGIGTTTPAEKVDVKGALAINGKSNVDKTASLGVDYFTGQSRILSWGPDAATNGIISFWNGLGGGSTSERMRIHSNGNVGIGTATPQKQLHVAGALQVTNEINVGGSASTAGSAGTAGQILTSAGAGAAPTWQTPAAVSSVNIYNADGTLTGNRTVTQGTNTLAFNGTVANAFSVDGTTLSVDAANNRVGIGSVAPTNKLTVVDATNTNQFQGIASILANNLTQGVGIGWNGIQSIGTNTNADLSLNAKNTGNVVLQTQSTGNVGVGTSSPGVKLDVAQAIGTSEATQFRIINTSPVATNNTALMGFNSYNGGGATWGMGTIQNSTTNIDSNFHILFSNGGAYNKFFTIRPNTGNTSIGTATPQKRLHVNGDLQITSELNVGGSATTAGSAGTAGQILTSAGAGAAPTWQTPAAVSNVNIYNADGTLTGNRVVTQGARTLAFTGTTANAFSVDGTTLSVDAANNRLGVGTTTPENKFHVVSTAAVANRFSLIDAPAGTNQQVIMALRNTSPAATGNYALLGFSNAGATSGGAAWGIGTIRTATGEDFFFGNSLGGAYLDRLRITSAGRVGIGTATPQETFHVNGTMQLTSELNVGGNASTAGSPGTAGQLLTSSGAGAAPKWTNSPIDADGTVNIANVAHHIINVNSRDNGTYVLDQTNGPNYTIWVTQPRTSGCDVQLPDATTQQRRTINIVAANDTKSVTVCGAPLYVTGTTSISVIPAGKRVIVGASNVFGAIWYVTMKDF